MYLQNDFPLPPILIHSSIQHLVSFVEGTMLSSAEGTMLEMTKVNKI